MAYGPYYGYILSPSKSWYICNKADKAAVIEAFQSFNLSIKMTRGYVYFEELVGNADTKDESLGKKKLLGLLPLRPSLK